MPLGKGLFHDDERGDVFSTGHGAFPRTMRPAIKDAVKFAELATEAGAQDDACALGRRRLSAASASSAVT